MTDAPDSLRDTRQGTDSLQDGWVAHSKTPRKTVLSAPPRNSDSKKESKPWDKVQDGWDKHR